MHPSIMVAALVLAAAPRAAGALDLQQGDWIDLTHAFDERTLYWPTARRFHKETVFDGVTEGGFYYSAFDLHAAEHGGTHLDAPLHFAAGADAADEVPLERLMGPAVVIDVREQVGTDRDYQLSAADLLEWEAAHGPIGAGDIVLVGTGYAARWPDAERYLGTAERGTEAVPLLHFPGIAADAARLLVERAVGAVGIDTASIDHGQSTDFMAHRILYGANVPGFENVASLDALPPRGAWVVALPMKIRGGSGAPLRIVAFVPAGD